MNAHHQFPAHQQRSELNIETFAVSVLEGDADAHLVCLLFTVFGVVLDDEHVEATGGGDGGVLAHDVISKWVTNTAHAAKIR